MDGKFFFFSIMRLSNFPGRMDGNFFSRVLLLLGSFKYKERGMYVRGFLCFETGVKGAKFRLFQGLPTCKTF